MAEISNVKDANKAWHFDFECQWKQWIPWNWSKYNWQNFDFIRFDVEREKILGDQFEINLSLIGFTLKITWINTLERSVVMSKIDQIKSEIRDSKTNND